MNREELDLGSPMLRVTGLVKEFGKRQQAFKAVNDVSFTLNRGETLGLVGESGSGKSTTARMVARLIDATAGDVEFEGRSVTKASRTELQRFRSQVQVVFQDPYSSLNPRHSVEKIVTAPLTYLGKEIPGGARDFTRSLMERVGLNPDHSTRRPSQFSGGQAQRIGIARAIAVSPQMIICDEAVSALDVSVQAQVINLLKELQHDEGFGYLFIAHDLAVVRQIATHVAVMSQGSIVEIGECDAVFDAPQHEYTRELLSAIPRINPEWDTYRRANSKFIQEEGCL